MDLLLSNRNPSEGEYKKGKKIGRWLKYHDTSELFSTSWYDKGKLSGNYIEKS